jgi:peptide/nickel transport system ATP-binding protein
MSNPSPNLLSVRDLNVSFATARGEAKVLRGVSLDMARGQIVGVVGESGSGKSTLATALLRLMPGNLSRMTGSVKLDGMDLLTLPPAQMRALRGARISMIFQDPMSALNPVFSIRTLMTDVQRAKTPGASRAQMHARAVAMLEKVGIPDAAQRITDYPHQFSGGMRQRIMIAMALLTEPDLLIADEATTALDVTIEAQIVRLLEALREDTGVSILFISHSLGLVAELCDQVVVMYAGTVVESGPAAALFARPAHPYTQALLACEQSTRDQSEAKLVVIPGEVPDLTTVPQGCIFAGRCACVMSECLVHVPALRAAGPGHRAACLLVPGAQQPAEATP